MAMSPEMKQIAELIVTDRKLSDEKRERDAKLETDKLTEELRVQSKELKAFNEAVGKDGKKLNDMRTNEAKLRKQELENSIKDKQATLAVGDQLKISNSDAKQGLVDQKSGLEQMRLQIEANGGVAEDNREYNIEANRIRREELELRIQNTDSRAKKKELRKELKQERREALKDTFAPFQKSFNLLGDGLKGLAGKAGGAITGAAGGLFGGLKKLALFALIPALIMFLGSDTWKNLKKVILDDILPALGVVYEKVIKPIGIFLKDAFIAVWTTIKDNIEEISNAVKFLYESVLKPIGSFIKEVFIRQWENLKELFSGIGDAIKKFQEGDVLGGISTLIGSLGTFFLNTIDNLITSVFNLFAGFFGMKKIGEGESVGSLIKGFFTSLGSKIKNFFVVTIPETFTNIKTVFMESLTSAIEFIKGLSVFKFFEETFTSLKSNLMAVFKAPDLSSLMKALFGVGKSLFDIVYYPINVAVNAIKDIFKLGDPDVPFKLSDFVIDTMKKIFGFIKESFTKKINDLKRMGGKILSFFGIGKKTPDEEVVPTKELDVPGGATFAGGTIPANTMGMVADDKTGRGGEFVMSKSPIQVFSEQRTDQMGQMALNRLMGGGGMGGGGGTTMINTGSNIQNNTSSKVIRMLSNDDPIIERFGNTLAI